MRPLLLFLIALGAAATAEEAARSRELRLGWWNPPPTTPGPALGLGPSAAPEPFRPQVMNLGTKVRHIGGDIAQFLLRETSTDAAGREVVTWVPFCNVPLPRDADTVGVLLVTDASGKRGGGRAFPLGDTQFPFGGVSLVNLTNGPLALGIDGQGITVPSGEARGHPRVFGANATIAEVTVLAGSAAARKQVFSTKSQFSSAFRLAVFVLEQTGTSPGRHEVRTIVDYPGAGTLRTEADRRGDRPGAAPRQAR